MIHNLTKDLVGVAVLFGFVVSQLAEVCKLLSKRHLKARLFQTYFSSMPHRVFYNDFATFNHRGMTHRWGNVVFGLAKLLLLQAPLRSAWSSARYRLGSAAPLHPRDDPEHSIQIDVADEAIRSDEFWAYLFMLPLVGEFLSRLASWAESCRCHDAELGLRGATYHERCKAKLKALGARICPMSGRRAPECAAGAIYDLLIGLFEVGHATLLMADPVRRLSAESRARVIRDFASIRRHVL